LAGYVLAGINSTRRGAGLVGDIHRADVQVLLVDDEHRELLADLDLGDVQVVEIESEQWAEEGASAGPFAGLRGPGAMVTFVLIFTAGTCGDPKAVQVGVPVAVFAGLMLAAKYAVGTADVCSLSMPLFHSSAILGGWSVAINSGAAMVPTKF